MGKISKALEKAEESNRESSINVESPNMVDNHPKSVSSLASSPEELVENPNMDDDFSKEKSFELPGCLHSSIITHLKAHSFEAEQFRILKTNILFPNEGIPPRVIMVTSTAPGEGKSFVASNLAVSIASSIDEYVMLMDCDMRLPSLHTRFGFSHIPGLSEYLLDGLPLESILQKTSIDKLSLLPAGKPPSNPSELISSEQMRRLLHEVKNRYEDRFVIIDSPPPYLTSEASVLARQVDGIVIVVKIGKTKISDVQDLIDTYGKKKILGIVKNFAGHKQGFKKYEYK